MTESMAKVTKRISVEIINYPGALQSSVHGIQEFLLLANKQTQVDDSPEFVPAIREPSDLSGTGVDIVVLPPNMDGEYFLHPEQALLDYLLTTHAQGSVICSVCAGAFILAQSGLLRGRTITTHWQLEQQLSCSHPDVNIDINKIVIDDVDIITAGGLMSWMDLCFALVTRYANARDTRQLGKYLVVDTGVRDQRYYQSFSPNYSHGDDKIALVQRHIQASYSEPLDIDTLATLACMTSRTFIRHFSKATGLTPIHYIQRVRIQKACEWLESSAKSVEHISYLVGYEDVNSFRKVFVKAIGLTPSAFRSRFVATQNGA